MEITAIIVKSNGHAYLESLWSSPEKAQKELDRVEALAENNERVQASLEYRRQWTEAMVEDFLSAYHQASIAHERWWT